MSKIRHTLQLLHGGTLSTRQIGAALGISKSTVSEIALTARFQPFQAGKRDPHGGRKAYLIQFAAAACFGNVGSQAFEGAGNHIADLEVLRQAFTAARSAEEGTRAIAPMAAQAVSPVAPVHAG